MATNIAGEWNQLPGNSNRNVNTFTDADNTVVTAIGTITTATSYPDYWPTEEPILELANGEIFEPHEVIQPWQWIGIDNTAVGMATGTITTNITSSSTIMYDGDSIIYGSDSIKLPTSGNSTLTWNDTG